MFSDDTSVIITGPNKIEFQRILSHVIGEIFTWCKKNYVTLNFEKMQFIQFVTNHHKHLDIQVKIEDIVISRTTNVKFLILNFHRVLIVVSFLLGKSPASVY